MIINLFTRTFLASDNMKRFNKGKFKYIDLALLNLDYEKKNDNELFLDLCDKVLKNNTHSYIFLIANPTDFKYIMARYCSYLDLDFKSYLLYIEHYRLFKEEWMKLNEFDINDNKEIRYINSFDTFKIDKKINEDMITQEIFKFIPAEYFINLTNLYPIAYNKYNSFRIYDIIDELLHLEIELFNSNKDIPKVILELRKDNKEELKNVIENNPSIEKELYPIFKEYGYNYNLLLKEEDTKDLYFYIDLNTRMGYSALNLFKYNKGLANYLRKINYKIPLEINISFDEEMKQ